MIDIVIVGAGQYCRNVIDTINNLKVYNIIGILDNTLKIGDKVSGIPIIGTDYDRKNIFNKCKKAFIGVGSIKNQIIRTKLFNMYKETGFDFPIIIDKTAIVSTNVTLGIGTFVGKGAIINNDVLVGENCIINTGAVVEHDCIIKDNVHIAPSTTLCGGITIEKETHIGANSTIIQGIIIGEKTTIGIGSVVLKDIPSNVIAFGNPCKIKE